MPVIAPGALSKKCNRAVVCQVKQGRVMCGFALQVDVYLLSRPARCQSGMTGPYLMGRPGTGSGYIYATPLFGCQA